MKLSEFFEKTGIRQSFIARQVPCTASFLSRIKNTNRRPHKIYTDRIERLTYGMVKAEDFDDPKVE